MIACGFAEDDQIEQGVGAQAIGAVNRHAGAFADGVKAIHNRIRIAVFRFNHLAVIIGRNAAHHVMTGWDNGNRFFDRIDVSKLNGDFADARQAFIDNVGA